MDCCYWSMERPRRTHTYIHTYSDTKGKSPRKLRWAKNKALDRAVVSGDNTWQTKIAWVLVCVCVVTPWQLTPPMSFPFQKEVDSCHFLRTGDYSCCCNVLTHAQTHRGGERPILTHLIYIFCLSCGRILGINTTLHFLTFNAFRQ